MPRPKTAAHTLREPAQSKCMSTFHKSHFIRTFTGKMPRHSWSTQIKHRPLHLITVRTPQCGHTVWGKSKGDVPGYCSVSVLTKGAMIYGMGSQKEAVRSRKAPLLPRTLVTVPFRRSWKTRH